jgi:hypothetical protein
MRRLVTGFRVGRTSPSARQPLVRNKTKGRVLRSLIS